MLHRILSTPLYHCVSSVRIQSYSGPYRPRFGLSKERYRVSLRIQSECGKIRTRITPITDTFYAVYVLPKFVLQNFKSSENKKNQMRRRKWPSYTTLVFCRHCPVFVSMFCFWSSFYQCNIRFWILVLNPDYEKLLTRFWWMSGDCIKQLKISKFGMGIADEFSLNLQK